MFPLMSAKDRFGAAPLCSAVLSAFPPLCASVSLPPSASLGGCLLDTGVCKHRSESVLGSACAVTSCVSAKGAREIAKYSLSRTESFFLLYFPPFPPTRLFWHALQSQQFIVSTRASGGPALTEIRCFFPINLEKKKNIHKG